MNNPALKNITETTKNYLAEYDSAAEHVKFPLIKQWMKTEPLALFKQLRAERPILVTPECVLVSLYSDSIDALEMPTIFTVDLYKPKMGVTATDPGYLMAHDDDALHYREKSVMKGMLNRDDLPRIRQLIKAASKNILTSANGKIEIVNDYCRMVPATLVQDYFGLDGVDKKDLIEWSFWNQYDVFHNQPFDLHTPEQHDHIVKEHDAVTVKLSAYIKKTTLRKLGAVKIDQTKNIFLLGWNIVKGVFNKIIGKTEVVPVDDVFTRMLRTTFAEQVDFPLERVGVNAGGLLIGAIETTSQAVSQVIDFLLTNDELLARAKATALLDNTKEFDNLVWEALRFVPISPYMFRQMGQDYVLAKGTPHETLIPAKTNVLILTQSAMFDPYAYDNPDEFITDRNFYHNFTFGFASHDCLGKYIGMEMIPEMVRQVMLLPGVKNLGPMDYKNGPFPEFYELNWS